MALLFLAYIAIFMACLAYEYRNSSPRVQRSGGSTFELPAFAASKKNYASAKYMSEAAAPVQLDQKYERTATVQTRSKAFEEDEKKIRDQIGAYNGIIQFESGRGTKGNRALYLHVGVQPARFDAFYGDIQKIGIVRSMEITKTDKTNEFLTLKAKRASLEKNRAALMELKKRDGRIDELMALEAKILNIEEQLQNLGVSLGEFDEVNAFCTVRFTLTEYTEYVSSRSWLSYCKSAFFDAAAIWAGCLALLFLLCLTAGSVLWAADRFGVIRKIVDEAEKK